MQIYDYLFWLFLYSFFGWIYESTLCSITEKKFVNRGFLSGPICPIYGCGAVAVIFCLSSLKSTVAIFIVGMVLTCSVEYITSWLLEKIFNARWWDYTHYKINLNGRVCLLGAIVFGTFATVLLKYIHPKIQEITLRIPAPILMGSVSLVVCLAVGDCTVTVIHILKLKGKLAEIQIAMNAFVHESYSRAKDLKETLHENFERSKFYNKRIQELVENANMHEKRLLNAFPRLKSLYYNEALEHFKYKRKKALNKFKELRRNNSHSL